MSCVVCSQMPHSFNVQFYWSFCQRQTEYEWIFVHCQEFRGHTMHLFLSPKEKNTVLFFLKKKRERRERISYNDKNVQNKKQKRGKKMIASRLFTPFLLDQGYSAANAEPNHSKELWKWVILAPYSESNATEGNSPLKKNSMSFVLKHHHGNELDTQSRAIMFKMLKWLDLHMVSKYLSLWRKLKHTGRLEGISKRITFSPQIKDSWPSITTSFGSDSHHIWNILTASHNDKNWNLISNNKGEWHLPNYKKTQSSYTLQTVLFNLKINKEPLTASRVQTKTQCDTSGRWEFFFYITEKSLQ